MGDNIKMDLKEIVLVEDRDQWWAVENIVMNFPGIL
jgi:hypothetical protein